MSDEFCRIPGCAFSRHLHYIDYRRRSQGMEMNQWEVLQLICPRLYSRRVSFECGIGWYNIIHDLSMRIERVLQTIAIIHPLEDAMENEYYEIFAIQVKEKYGTLRFYVSYLNEEIANLIAEAEELSRYTCECCGHLGKIRGSKWFSVRCAKCYSEDKMTEEQEEQEAAMRSQNQILTSCLREPEIDPPEPPKPRLKAKRDIIRFTGDKPTAINLEHVTTMYLEGKRITFDFYTKAQFIDFADEAAAASVFEVLLTTWSSDVVE